MRIMLTTMALALAAPSLAAPTADALYQQGQFGPAANAARAAGDHVLAARAQLIAAAFQATTKEQALTLLDFAMADANAALAKNPNNADAVLQRALVLGYRAKLKKDAGDAKAARKGMEQARSMAPNSALAWAALGGWHGDAIIDVGAMLAGMALGAKKGEATKNFETAIAKDPANPVYPAYYAIMLLRMEKGAPVRAQALLQTASTLRARDGFESLMKVRAIQMLNALKSGNPELARTLAVQLAPFGRITAKPS